MNMNTAFTKHEIPKSCFYEVMTFQIPDTIIPGAFPFCSPFHHPINSSHGFLAAPVQVEPCRRQTFPVPTFAHSGPYRPFPPSGLDWTFIPRGIGLFFAKKINLRPATHRGNLCGRLACPGGYSGPCFRSTYFDRS